MSAVVVVVDDDALAIALVMVTVLVKAEVTDGALDSGFVAAAGDDAVLEVVVVVAVAVVAIFNGLSG